jgi:hypothetical protein
MIARRTYIRRTPLVRKPRRYVVPAEIMAYWDWIREQPCAVSICDALPWRRYNPIEAAHVGVRGLAQKGDPWEVIPLCRFHHGRGYPHSHHVLGKKFWSFHGLDRMGLIRMYRLRYFGLTGISSAIEGCSFDREAA